MQRLVLVWLLAAAACSGVPKPAAHSDVTDLKAQVAGLQALLDEEVALREEADAQRDAAIAALRDGGELGPASIEALGRQVEALGQQLLVMQAAVGGAREWIDTVGEPLQGRIATLDARVSDIQASIALIDGRVSGTDATVAAIGADVQALDEDTRELLAYLTVDRGSDSVVIEGANLRIVSGGGSTDAPPNGLGNLVVGYDEGAPGDKTGSHNLVVGGDHAYVSTGGAVFGESNRVEGASASVLGGEGNTAAGDLSVVLGGFDNAALSPGIIVP